MVWTLSRWRNVARRLFSVPRSHPSRLRRLHVSRGLRRPAETGSADWSAGRTMSPSWRPQALHTDQPSWGAPAGLWTADRHSSAISQVQPAVFIWSPGTTRSAGTDGGYVVPPRNTKRPGPRPIQLTRWAPKPTIHRSEPHRTAPDPAYAQRPQRLMREFHRGEGARDAQARVCTRSCRQPAHQAERASGQG